MTLVDLDYHRLLEQSHEPLNIACAWDSFSSEGLGWPALTQSQAVYFWARSVLLSGTGTLAGTGYSAIYNSPQDKYRFPFQSFTLIKKTQATITLVTYTLKFWSFLIVFSNSHSMYVLTSWQGLPVQCWLLNGLQTYRVACNPASPFVILKLPALCTAWTEIAVAHGKIEKGPALTDLFIKQKLSSAINRYTSWSSVISDQVAVKTCLLWR